VALVGAVGANGVTSNTGGAYVFERNHGGADNWGEVAVLVAPLGKAGDRLGESVAVSGEVALLAHPESIIAETIPGRRTFSSAIMAAPGAGGLLKCFGLSVCALVIALVKRLWWM